MTKMPSGLLGLGIILGLSLGVSVFAAEPPPAAPAVWHEGEDFAQAPAQEAKVVGEKLPASGAKVLWGMALHKKGSVVRYEGNMPQTVPDARIIFRYARQHWKPGMAAASIPLEIAGGGRTLRGNVVFDATGGWGGKPGEWGLVTVNDLGTLPAGPWSLTLTSPANDSDICLDGFWIAPPRLRLSAAEFASLLRIRIGADGYLGLRARTLAMDQRATKTPALLAVVRSFAGPAGEVKAALTDPSGKTVELKAGAPAPEGQDGAQSIAFGVPSSLGDGTYALRLSCRSPALELQAPILLAGELLGGFDERVGALRAFAQELPGMGPAAGKCKDDFAYALEYLPARGRELREACSATATSSASVPASAPASTSSGDANAARRPPVAAKARDPEIIFGNIARTLAQYEETAKLLRAGANPIAGRTGDLRRAFATKAPGQSVRCRIFIPSNYAQADKMPMTLVLHGGGDDEDGMSAVQNGRIFELAEKRGYVMVCPGYRRDFEGSYMDAMLEVIARVRSEYPKIDPARIYSTGFSMGGTSSSQLAAFYPQFFAAVSCGGGAGQLEWVQNIKIPIQVIQGGADEIVTPQRTAEAVKVMESFGVKPEVHVIPLAGHEYLPDEFMTRALDFFDKHPKKAPATAPATVP